MLIDVHCHLDRYTEDPEHALEQIKEHRIFTITNSMDLPSYMQNIKIAAASDLILPVFGIHPWNASEYVGRLDGLDWAISESPLIGEIGLDYSLSREPRNTMTKGEYLSASSERQAGRGRLSFYTPRARRVKSFSS